MRAPAMTILPGAWPSTYSATGVFATGAALGRDDVVYLTRKRRMLFSTSAALIVPALERKSRPSFAGHASIGANVEGHLGWQPSARPSCRTWVEKRLGGFETRPSRIVNFSSAGEKSFIAWYLAMRSSPQHRRDQRLLGT